MHTWPAAEGGPSGNTGQQQLLFPLYHLFVQMLESILSAGSPPCFPQKLPAPLLSSHLFDGCHAHSLIVVQGCIGCVHVVAEARDCHFITAMQCHGHCHTAKGWDVLAEERGEEAWRGLWRVDGAECSRAQQPIPHGLPS